MLFRDRTDAGRRLAEHLQAYAHRSDVIVLGLPRGGVPVAYEVARALGAPLDVFVVRKLGAPEQPELALGAVATGGVRVLNHEIVRALGLTGDEIEAIAVEETEHLERLERSLRDELPAPDVRGKTVILVDDGLATGATMRAAVAAVRELQPARVVVAVPVAAPATCHTLLEEADEVVCAVTPSPFLAVGSW